jgi:predicted ABC-type ATPase
VIDETLLHRGFFEWKDSIKKPLAIILAGHNGSGKSSMWYEGDKRLVDLFKLPLINADRMMMSILPITGQKNSLPQWARDLRDTDESWMQVAQSGVKAFIAHAMAKKVSFATETVFSHWQMKPDGHIASKIDDMRELQKNGYIVLLIFVGLSSYELSVGRVLSRKSLGGHNVPLDKLESRFPRTQAAIAEAIKVADASILVDNSRRYKHAFTTCHFRIDQTTKFDIRQSGDPVPKEISKWLDRIVPDF